MTVDADDAYISEGQVSDWALGALALVLLDSRLSCLSLPLVAYLVGWHSWGLVAPNELMSCPGAVKLTLSG